MTIAQDKDGILCAHKSWLVALQLFVAIVVYLGVFDLSFP